MSSVVAPPPSEREEWDKKQKEFKEKCRVKDIADPPKNMAHKVARSIWRILTFPRDPRTY